MSVVPTWQAWLGAAIQAARQQAELTQADLAARLGVRQSSVSQWERGTTAPTTKHLLVLQQLLGPALIRQLLGHESQEVDSCCAAGLVGADVPDQDGRPPVGSYRQGSASRTPGRGPATPSQTSEAATPWR